MTGNIKTIKFLVLPTLGLIILTYIFDVHTNINNNFITTDFLTTIFAGLFTSAMIVLMLELQKYFFNKNNAEAYMFNCAMRIYTELSIAKGNLQSFIEHTNETVPKELLSNRLPFINQVTSNIEMIDYTPLEKNNLLLAKLNYFKHNTSPNLCKFVSDFAYLEITIIQESMKVDAENLALLKQFQNYSDHKTFIATSENENIRAVLKKLVSDATVQLTTVDLFLSDIDLLCKNKYCWSKYKKTIDNQKYDITEQHKITEDFIRN